MCEMKFLVEDDVRQLFARLCTGLAAALLAAECASWALCPALCLPLLGLFVLLAAGVLGSAAAYFARRQKRLEEAAAQVRALLDGDATARLDSGREGRRHCPAPAARTGPAALAGNGNSGRLVPR